MIDQALSPRSGKLSIGETSSEKAGWYPLYRSVISVFENPSSHRFVEYDEEKAKETIALIDFLLKLIEKV